MNQKISGFTTVELIIVLVVIGILAIYATPRFIGRGGFSELTVQQDLIQSIRFAQQAAMSRTDRTIALVTTANTINVLDVNANAPLPNYPKQIPDDVVLTNSNLVFNRLGFAGNTNAIIRITGKDQIFNITVEGTTGYAHN